MASGVFAICSLQGPLLQTGKDCLVLHLGSAQPLQNQLDISAVAIAAMSPHNWIQVPIGLLSAEDRDCVSGFV